MKYPNPRDIAGLLQYANSIPKMKPYPRPKRDYVSTFTEFNMYLKHYKANKKNMHAFKLNVTSAKQHSSLRDLKDLKPILLKDMQVNKIHYGHYLECETVTEPFYTTGMSLLVVDENGEIESVAIYNYKCNDVDLSHLVPTGTKVIIKEPYLKSFACDKGEFGIRVDSPTDIIFHVDRFEPNKTHERIIDEGNSHFKKANYHLAIESYSIGIHQSHQKSAKAYLNRSAAYLKLEKYYQAYTDAEKSAQLEPSNEKAYFRMGKAAYMMRQFEKAKKHFESCLNLNQQNKEAQIELARSKARIAESITGVYDFESIMKQYLKGSFYFDVEDFKSPSIVVTDIPNKFKGVIATEDIKRGTLLMASKAISAHKNTQDSGDSSQNFADIIYKMQADPELAKNVYSLYPGPDFNRNEKISEYIVDTLRVQEIQKYNSFKIESHFDCVDNQMEDINSKGSGLWLFPSFLNHSCVGNAIRVFLGDLLLIYAKKDVNKGEEITVNYFSSDLNTDRKEKCFKYYNFKCDCRLCVVDSKDTNQKKREPYLNEILSKKANSNLSRISLNELLEDEKFMRKSYANQNELQIGLILALENLALKYRQLFNYQKSADIYEEIYKITKDYCDIVSVVSLKQLHKFYENKKTKYDWCHKAASEYYGDNKPFFDSLWEKIR